MHTPPQTIELNGPALKAEAEKSHEFLTLVYYGANRDRNREITDIEQMRKGIELRNKETLHPDRWIEAFKKLEDMGLGALIMGRRGNPNRFRWNYSLKAIGQAAVNGIHLTAHRIVPKEKGGKTVNDYHSSQPFGTASVSIKSVEGNTTTSSRLETPIKVVRDEPKKRPTVAQLVASSPLASSSTSVTVESGPRHFIHITLRQDYAFEAEIPRLTEKEADLLCSIIRKCTK